MADYSGRTQDPFAHRAPNDSPPGRVLKLFDQIDPPPPTVYYDQRLWDTGSGGRYVYYTKTTKDPSPSSGETEPNYSGSISGHVILAERQT
jgi:hypothetical protein